MSCLGSSACLGRALVKVATVYTIFAIAAALANFGSQALALAFVRLPFREWIALFVGTAVGLVVKYLLDKKWIFAFRAVSRKHEGRTFVVYTVFSIVTTIIFWVFEMGALFLFGSKLAQFVGGAIGLAIGYVSKYWLDKRYTFISSESTKPVGRGEER